MRLRRSPFGTPFKSAARYANAIAASGLALSCRGTSRRQAVALDERDVSIIATTPPAATPALPVFDAAIEEPRLPARPNEWCIEGFSAIDEETCYLLPTNPGKTHKLLIYLHGIISPIPKDDPQRVVQTVVMNAVQRSDYAVLIPRGQRGIGPGSSKDWWAWPTTASDYSKYATRILARFAARKTDLETIVGAPYDRTYLAGSSNGAYFLTTIALHGAFAADGYGVMSGGSASGTQPAALNGIARRPFYIGIPIYDATEDGERALGRLLAAAKWPHQIKDHPFGHGAKEAYLHEAFAYWDSMTTD